MSAIIATLLISILHVINAQTKDAYYGNWMDVLSTNSDNSGFDTSTLRLVDIVIPGSHHAGMYPAAIKAQNYQDSQSDAYYTDVLQYFENNATNTKLMEWSKRQSGTVLEQLTAGSRYLDIRLETKTGDSTIYTHNGLLGATLEEV